MDVIDYYCIVIAGILSLPTFLPKNIRENFVVVGSTTLLIPLVLYRNPDMQHQGKNAEKTGTLYGFGNGVSLSEGDFKPDLVKSALMRVARLLGKDHEIADLLREFTKSDEKLANIPGEVNHTDWTSDWAVLWSPLQILCSRCPTVVTGGVHENGCLRHGISGSPRIQA